MLNRRLSRPHRGRARTVALAILAITALGGTATTTVHAIPIGPDDTPTARTVPVVPDNGIRVYLSQACHNAAGSSTCRPNYGCFGYNENLGSGLIARSAAVHLVRRGYTVRIGTGTREANIRDSNAFRAQIHIPIHSNAGVWDCLGSNPRHGGTLVMHYGGRADNQLAQLMMAEVGAKSPGTSDRTSIRRDLAEITQTRARVAYLEAGYHTFGNDVRFLQTPPTWSSAIAQAVDRCRGFPRNGPTPTRTKECSW